MFDFQSHFIFPTHAVPNAGAWPEGAERLSTSSAQGNELSGIHIQADGESPSKTVILGFGGNAWNAQDLAQYLHEIFPNEEIVAFHYRGYAPSRGSPSAEALIADAPRIYDFAVEALKPDHVVAVGFSIGSGVAARLALARKLDGVILVTPFDSLREVARSMLPWLPIGPFFAHEIDAAEALEQTKTPVAIIGAQHDEIVPFERTQALRKRVANLRFDVTIASSSHNSIYVQSAFHDAMREALSRFKL